MLSIPNTHWWAFTEQLVSLCNLNWSHPLLSHVSSLVSDCSQSLTAKSRNGGGDECYLVTTMVDFLMMLIIAHYSQMKPCHKAATGSQHMEEVNTQEGKWPLSPCSLPKCHMAQMVFTNTAHFDDHSSCLTSRSIYPPKKWGKNHLWDMAHQTKQKDLLRESSFLQYCEYVKGDTGNNITGNFITRKAELLLVM